MKFTSTFYVLSAILLASAAPSPSAELEENWRNSTGKWNGPSSQAPHHRGGDREGGESTALSPRTTFTRASETPSRTSSIPAANTASSASASPSDDAPPSKSASLPGGTPLPPATGASANDVVGAVYFPTNDPNGNSVVISTIGSDGNVSFAGIVSVDGLGEHGNDGGNFGSDSTFSNNLIIVHADRQMLATANTLSNTVCLYSIDENNLSTLQMLGNPISSNGDFPLSLVFNQAGDQLCVLNAGAQANVFCYDVNDDGLAPRPDSLRSIPNYNQTTPPRGPSNTAATIAFTEDERNLVITVKGTQTPPTPGFLVAWPVSNGTLAEQATVIPTSGPGNLTFSLTPVPGRNAFISADFTSALNIFDFNVPLDQVSRSNKTGSYVVGGDMILCWSAYSPTLDRYYLSAPVDSLVVEYDISDDLVPTPIANHTIVPGAANIDISIGTINGQDYMYALLTNTTSIGVLRLDGPGQTTMVGSANLSQAVTDSGGFIRKNYASGLALFMKSGSS